MYFSLFSVNMAILCSTLLLLVATASKRFIVRNFGSNAVFMLYVLAVLRMAVPVTPYSAVKISAAFPLNAFQALADVPLILSHRRVRLSSWFCGFWLFSSLLFLSCYLVYRFVKRRSSPYRNFTRFQRCCLLLWDVSAIALWVNPFLWAARNGFITALTHRKEKAGEGRKRRAPLLFSACAVLIVSSYGAVLVSHFEPGPIEYRSYEAVADQVFIEPLPYGGYALHDHGYSSLLDDRERERREEEGIPVIWAK